MTSFVGGDRFSLVHASIPGVVAIAQALLAPRRIWLFGSRARGTEHATSDIDLAFEFADKTRWSEFVAEVEEHAATLLDVDLVDIDRCDKQLRDEILKTGRLLHG
jgi:predicted nucleotidyltransferase